MPVEQGSDSGYAWRQGDPVLEEIAKCSNGNLIEETTVSPSDSDKAQFEVSNLEVDNTYTLSLPAAGSCQAIEVRSNNWYEANHGPEKYNCIGDLGILVNNNGSTTFSFDNNGDAYKTTFNDFVPTRIELKAEPSGESQNSAVTFWNGAFTRSNIFRC